MEYNLRKRNQRSNNSDEDINRASKRKRTQEESDSDWEPNQEQEEESGSGSSSESDSDSESDSQSINSDDLTDIDDNYDDENVTTQNLDLLNEDSLKRKLTKSILEKIQNELSDKKKVNIDSYLSELEQKISTSEFTKDEEHKNNIVSLSAVELSNSILRNLISEVRYESKYNKDLNLKDYIDNKLELLNEIEALDADNKRLSTLPPSRGNGSNIILQLMIDPMKYLNQHGMYEEEDEEDYDYEDELLKKSNPKDNLDKQFHKFLTNGVITPKDDMQYFKNLSKDEKKKIFRNN